MFRLLNYKIIIPLAILGFLFAFAPTALALPFPNHEMWFGYYFVNSQYGFFLNEVKDYTNLEIILAESFLREANPSTSQIKKLNRAFQESIAAGHKIIYNVSQNIDRDLEVAKPFWTNVNYVYVADEPDWDQNTAEQAIKTIKDKITKKGLEVKPFIVNFTFPQIIEGTGYKARNLDIVGIEAYLEPNLQNRADIENILQERIDQMKEKITHKKIMLVLQGYNRNGAWKNIESLKKMQTKGYLTSYKDKDVIGILTFSYARKGGTKDVKDLIPIHKMIGEAILKNQIPTISFDFGLIGKVGKANIWLTNQIDKLFYIFH